MIPLLLALTLTAPGAVGGGVVRTGGTGVVRSSGASNVLAWFQFDSRPPGCYDTGSAFDVRGAIPIAQVRSGSRVCPVAGGYQTCTANQVCITEFGLWSEPGRANIHPTPTAPAAGTATATATGAHFFSVVGSGSQDLSFGTATGTGLPCTATQAAPCSFSVSATGTLTLSAVTGVLSVGSIEAGLYRTTPIPGASRAADAMTATVRIPPRFCVHGRYTTPTRAWALGGAAKALWVLGTFGSANSSGTYVDSSSNTKFSVYDTAAAVRYVDIGTTAWVTTHRITTCNAGGVISAYKDGLAVSIPQGAGTAVQVMPSLMTFGRSSSAGTEFGGALGMMIWCSGMSAGACATRSGLDATMAASLGDSITVGQGGTKPYPLAVSESLGSTWSFANHGIGGDRAANMVNRWRDNIAPWPYSTLTVMGGINDILAGVSADAVLGYLTAIFDEAKSSGKRVVPITILPCIGRCGPDQNTARLTVNAGIMAWCVATGSTCVDAATDMDNGSGALKPEYDSGDHLHPNQAGYDRITVLLRSAFP